MTGTNGEDFGRDGWKRRAVKRIYAHFAAIIKIKEKRSLS